MNVMQLLLKRYKKRVNKVIKGGNILSILFALIISLVISPFNIYADSPTSSNIIGINRTLTSITFIKDVEVDNITRLSQFEYVYDYEVLLDDYYVGYIKSTISQNFINYSYSSNDGYSTTLLSSNIPYKNNYVNGNSFHVSMTVRAMTISGNGGNDDPCRSYTPTITIDSNNPGNITKYQDLDSIDTIINILNDIDDHVYIDVLGELQNIVSNTSLANTYLSHLEKIRYWNIPFESIPFVLYQFYFQNTFVQYPDVNNYYDYPIYQTTIGKSIGTINITNNTSATLILGSTPVIYNQNIATYFDIDTSKINVQYESLGSHNTGRFSFYLAKLILSKKDGVSGTVIINLKAKDSFYYMPIYLNYSNINTISTDFALRFGLTNKLLDELHIIANGTIQSNQSSSDLETQNGSFDTTSNDLYTSENAFNTDMNSKLQSIDTSFNPSTSFGSKFLSSADWVRTQFNNLTSTSPFGTVLSFSMLLGLSLLIIGKVFK